MYYITTRQRKRERQISWLDLLNDSVPDYDFNQQKGSAGTITRAVETINPELLQKINVDWMISVLKQFNEMHNDLITADKRTLYRHFTIPKRTGGLRPIDAPVEILQEALRSLKIILSEKFGLLYHTAAYAYINNRSTVQEVRKHQANESNWFLKTDFSGFFPSTTLDFTMRMVSMIFPLSEICKREDGRKELKTALSLAFLNDKLPQGTVLSPFLTNLIMIPIDHRIFNDLAHKRYVYTRYADDIHISCVQKFDYRKMISYMRGILKEFGAPYIIKDEKTRFGSRKGSNWMLGVMLNKDNNITVGYRNKKLFKAMTTNLIMDWKHRKYWDIDDVQHYVGLLSYYKMVEKDYFTKLIKHFEQKFNVVFEEVIKTSLNY